MAGDARLWDAFNYLTQHDDDDYSRSHVWGKVDRIVALRVGEKLFSPHVKFLPAQAYTIFREHLVQFE